MNILFTCAGRRNYLINYFKTALRGRGKVIAADMELSAPALMEADISVEVPEIYAPDYIQSLQSIVERYDVNAIIGLNDLELPILASNRLKLEQSGAKVLVSDEKFIDISFDKWKSYKFFRKLGILTPKTFLSITDAQQAIKTDQLTYPLILKPRWGSASIGVEVADNETELLLSYALLKIKISKSILKHTCLGNEDNCIIIQEKLAGQEYGMDILNDLNGKYYHSFVRKKLALRAGETDKAISVINRKFTDTGKKIGAATGHIGTMDCDFFVDNDQVYFLEMNPRFGGGYPFSHEAGIDIPSIYISWLQGISDVSMFNNYKANIAFSKCDSLISTMQRFDPQILTVNSPVINTGLKL